MKDIQDEIDRDIIAHFGSTYDLDNIIGDPSTGSYQELEILRREYFKKYVRKYNYKDYIRLIEFFHNSLFIKATHVPCLSLSLCKTYKSFFNSKHLCKKKEMLFQTPPFPRQNR